MAWTDWPDPVFPGASYDHWKTTPPDDWDEPEAEEEADARAAEEEWDNWLATWRDDFWSDEWAATLPPKAAKP